MYSSSSASPPSPALRLGNDVVDLRHPRILSKADRTGLMARILSERERVWVAHGEPGWALRLWAAWAAKECGFKVACKWPGPRPVFRHAEFTCRLELRHSDEDCHEICGEVLALGFPVRVSGWANDSVLHIAGTGGPSDAAGATTHRVEFGVEKLPDPDDRLELGETLRDRFTDREWAGVHGFESAWARILARTRLASHLQISSADCRRIEILTSAERPGRTPPRVLMDGEPVPGVDLSMSHHGNYVGWGLLLPS